jgi:hypothetical protein
MSLFSGSWAGFYKAAGNMQLLSVDALLSARITVARSLVIASVKSSAFYELDLSAGQNLLVMPRTSTSSTKTFSPSAVDGSSSNGSPGSGSVPSGADLVTLSLQKLMISNAPPGPANSLPLSLSTLMMWSIDMDR